MVILEKKEFSSIKGGFAEYEVMRDQSGKIDNYFCYVFEKSNISLFQ